ncbi:MAG: TonB-dependent receptor plug domain-containing protein [Gammaproteobacteria bacterium]|nr:TonB-dependent receptor plug domain-containing protein [Gammaproteobacteria bacterium]MDP2141744.1 TonB-dependent receptor plug domain-containing protein [Gammaproteobacteria bacterium]MDP2347976.1 TonB-dependent receptor plug domain-containing protein [Gammaproteobacteria bacterium]
MSKKKFIPITCLIFAFSPAIGLSQNTSDDNASVTYPASYFSEFGSVSVNDMLNRIPGIALALDGNQVPSAGNNNNNRGLGAESQILINGKRMAGKANETRAQLDRIPAGQVSHIEIIRGTSGDLDVRNSGQLVNIVLLETQATSSISVEAGAAYYHDGTTDPVGSLSYSGQAGQLQYLISGAVSSAYEWQESSELSVLADGTLNETRVFDRQREQTNYSLNSNLVYQLSLADRVSLNALYGESNPPATLLRTITDLKTSPRKTLIEREDLPATADNWEIGGDYEHIFSDGARYKVLLIVNERNNDSIRERYVSSGLGQPETKNLFIATDSRYRERIARTSYSWNIHETHALELGLEGAQTIQNSALRLGSRTSAPPSADHGGLSPVFVPNAVSEVEEVRFEGFAVHNWQINSRMSLESSLLYEVSEIAQSGDVNKTREFDFIKPKLDFRFDISRSFQLRVSAEKDVSQLSFADFSASVNAQDDDQDTMTGNPSLEQEQTWRYNLNLDYRLPNDSGVLNSRLFYYDVHNSIGRVDISPNSQTLLSTNGNVGDGKIFGLYLNASIRLGFLDLPGAVVTVGLNLEDAYIHDPLIAKKRTIIPMDRGSFRIGFRHDVSSLNLSYGVNYQDGIGGVGGTGGNRVRYDIDNVLFYGMGKVRTDLVAFVEKVGYGNFTYRLEVNNALDSERCFERKRYNGHIRDRNLREIEYSCATTGPQVLLKVRATF